MAAKTHYFVARYSLPRLAMCYVSVAALRAPRTALSQPFIHHYLQELAA